MKHIISIFFVVVTILWINIFNVSYADNFASKNKIITLTWKDLVPKTQKEATSLNDLRRLEHSGLKPIFKQEMGNGVVNKFNEKRVKIPGFVVPLSFEGEKVTTIMLAPYLGACIHVPPPPANQLIFIELEDGYDSKDLYDPVWVTGIMDTTAVTTELAQAGYTMELEKIEPYRE